MRYSADAGTWAIWGQDRIAFWGLAVCGNGMQPKKKTAGGREMSATAFGRRRRGVSLVAGGKGERRARAVDARLGPSEITRPSGVSMPWHPTACVHASPPPCRAKRAARTRCVLSLPLLHSRSPCARPPVPPFRIAALLPLCVLVASTTPSPGRLHLPRRLPSLQPAIGAPAVMRCPLFASSTASCLRARRPPRTPPSLIAPDGHILASNAQSNSAQCLVELVTGPAVLALSAADHTSSRLQSAVVSYLPLSSLLPAAHKPHFRCQ